MSDTKISLSVLRAARAKMTQGEWEAVDEFVYDEQYAIAQALRRDEDAAGIVATHNAADLLIEIAEAALAWKEAGCDHAYCSADHHGIGCSKRTAEINLLAALARVQQ